METLAGVSGGIIGSTYLAKELRQAGSAGAERVLVLGAALGTAEVRRDSNASAVVEEVLDGGDRGANTGVVGDHLAIKGYVEIAADENLS